VNATGGATNFHAISVEPEWAPTLRRTAQIGNHVFYRGGPGGSVAPAVSVAPPVSNVAVPAISTSSDS